MQKNQEGSAAAPGLNTEFRSTRLLAEVAPSSAITHQPYCVSSTAEVAWPRLKRPFQSWSPVSELNAPVNQQQETSNQQLTGPNRQRKGLLR